MVFPPGNIVGEFVLNISVAIPLFQLDTITTDYTWIIIGGLWFHAEKVAEQILAGLNPKKGFAKMNEDGKMRNGVRIEMMCSKIKIAKQAVQEIRSRQGQSSSNKLIKQDDFFWFRLGKNFTKSRMPLNNILKIKKIISRALTFSPASR